MTDAQPTFAQIIVALESMSPEELKKAMPPNPTDQELRARFPQLAAVEVQDHAIGAPQGDVPARSYRVPGVRTRAGLVWVHGGGFIGGDLDMPEANWVALMLAARGVPVLSVDYRKCLNGTRYPAPSDDVGAAWGWALSNAEVLGVSATSLHLGGASAGANLVAGRTKRLRDDAEPMPRSLVLLYPLVHKDLPPPSRALAATLAVSGSNFTAESVREINLNYVGSEEALGDPYAFAANGDVSGQPPVFILNSEADALRSSGEAYGAQLSAAGVPVVVEYEPDSAHGHLNEPDSPAATRSIERMVRWIDSQSHD
jgi:acetyl esterase